MKIYKTDAVLIFCVVFLFCSFCFSFVPGKNKKSGREFLKTALISRNLIENINAIEFVSGEDFLEFKKDSNCGGLWFCGFYTDQGSFFIPASQEKVNLFLDELSKIRSLEKVSTSKSTFENFGLGDNYGFIVRYSGSGSSSEIRFGDSNFSDTGRYLKGNDDSFVYLADKSFDRFLFSGLNQWCDPYLVPRNVGVSYSASDFMNLKNPELLELRHGGISFYQVPESALPEKILRLEMGDTGEFCLSFYKIPEENSYYVEVVYVNEQKNGFGKIHYQVKISEWTYNKL